MKDKIIEILSYKADYYIDESGKSHDIIRATPEEIADELVKLCNMHFVSNSEAAVCPKCASEDVICPCYCNRCNEALL